MPFARGVKRKTPGRGALRESETGGPVNGGRKTMIAGGFVFQYL